MEVVANLSEEIKNPREHVGGYADTVVRNCYQNFIPVAARRQNELPALRGIFRSIVEKVADDLGKSREIGVQPDRRVWQVEYEFVAACGDQRIARFDRGLKDVAQPDPRLTELDLALAHPRHVHKIVNQTQEMRELSVHHVTDLFRVRGLWVRSQDVQPIADRRERIA